MKKLLKIITLFMFLLILFLFSGIYILNNKENNKEKEEKLRLDNENIYLVVTNQKWLTMENDGGSFTSSYYKIDFDKNTVTKYEDKYNGTLGSKNIDYVYKEKVIDTKMLEEQEKTELKELLDRIVSQSGSEVSENDKSTFSIDSYTISTEKYTDITMEKTDVENFIKLVTNN